MLAEDANDFDQRLKALIYDADQATYYIGFLKSVVANADVVHDRLNDSYCGFAGVTAYKGAKEGLILYCNRAWEDMSDAISLPNLSSYVTESEEFPESKKFSAFVSECNDVKSLPVRLRIKVMRSEWFSHRILKSRDRVRVKDEDFDFGDITYDDLIEFAEKTVYLVGKFASLLNRGTNLYPDRISRNTAIATEFWRLVPVFRDVEDPHF